MPVATAPAPAGMLMLGTEQCAVSGPAERGRHQGGVGRIHTIQHVDRIIAGRRSKVTLDNRTIQPLDGLGKTIATAPYRMDLQPHRLGLGEYVEDAGAGQIEFLRQRLTRMESAIGEAAQERE